MGNKLSSKVNALGNLKHDPDERWQSIARERNKNVLYKWVAEESELRKAYTMYGEEGVVSFANMHLVPLMFNEGTATQTIKSSDFEKYRMSATTVTDASANSSQQIPTSGTMKFAEHEALWRLNKRGLDGETLSNLLLKQESPACTDIVYMLVERFPGLVLDVTLGDQFFGETLLHLAIMREDLDLVEFLIEKGANVEARATGLFFQPDDQIVQPAEKLTSYVGYAYYGEYPLAFSAACGNKDMYDVLMRNGANPNRQDSYGNTVLHMCVIHDRVEMYTYAIRHYTTSASADIANHAGFTPLTLAAKMGRKHIFEEMCTLLKRDYWTYGDMTCGLYPLATLDTISADGTTNHASALMTIVNGKKTEHLDMLTVQVIQQLLDAKWKAFASRKIVERGALTLLHLMTLSTAIYLRSPDDDLEYNWDFMSWETLRTVSEIMVIIMCIIFVIRQQGTEILSEGLLSYARSLMTAPDKAMFLVANTCLLLCIPSRVIGYIYKYGDVDGTDMEWLVRTANDFEDVLLCIALPGSWFYLLFFARSIFLTGPFVQMIFGMIRGDILRFAIIAAIFLTTFSQAFYFLGEPMTHADSEMHLVDAYTFRSFGETFVTMFRMSMGGYDYEEFKHLHFEYFAKFFFVAYMIAMPIMMINMLIAMMGNTYTSIIVQAEKAWRAEWARIVILLEQSVKKQQLRKYQIEYSTEVVVDRNAEQRRSMKRGPNGKDAQEIEVLKGESTVDGVKETGPPRGLLIITRQKKSRAQQRKDAMENWKLIVHAIMRVRRELGSVELAWMICHRRLGKNSVVVDDMDIDPHVEDQLTAMLSQLRRKDRRVSQAVPHLDVGSMAMVAIAAKRFHAKDSRKEASCSRTQIPTALPGSFGGAPSKRGPKRLSIVRRQASEDTATTTLPPSGASSLETFDAATTAASKLNEMSAPVSRKSSKTQHHRPFAKAQSQAALMPMRDMTPPNVPPPPFSRSPPVVGTFQRKTSPTSSVDDEQGRRSK